MIIHSLPLLAATPARGFRIGIHMVFV